MCALGLRKWEFEDGSEAEDGEDVDEGDTGIDEKPGGTPTPAGRGRSQSVSTRSTSGGRAGKPSGIFKAEDISSYLANKGASEKRRLDIEEKKLKIENKKARLEGIALLVKAGISLNDAKRTWDEDGSDKDKSDGD